MITELLKNPLIQNEDFWMMVGILQLIFAFISARFVKRFIIALPAYLITGILPILLIAASIYVNRFAAHNTPPIQFPMIGLFGGGVIFTFTLLSKYGVFPTPFSLWIKAKGASVEAKIIGIEETDVEIGTGRGSREIDAQIESYLSKTKMLLVLVEFRHPLNHQIIQTSLYMPSSANMVAGKSLLLKVHPWFPKSVIAV